ncbi:RelA/SpoT AH/RIS domain-containing protein, partial [Enterococcus mundtii]
KRFFKGQDRDENVTKGHEALVKCIMDLGFVPKEILSKNKLHDALERLNFQTEEDMYAAIGYGEVSPLTMANRLTEKERKEQKI